MNRPTLRLVVVVTSSTALLDVNKTPSLLRAISGLREHWPTLPLTVCVSEGTASDVTQLLERKRVIHELIVCAVNSPNEIAVALLAESQSYDGLIFHDASRPFTTSELNERLTTAFMTADAVRPAIPFTETLKVVEPRGVIRETIDRTKVRRISTPEIIRTSAIDPKGKRSGWFVPLKKSAVTAHVEGNPEGLRINSVSDRDLLESFLHWKQTFS
ncbi:MAG: 2-C-methyl-D-erythritol 4-phosphate cytidylyltransferase [Actinobacteria bacterium]|nr:2-C-methyl-D-erythritol 4-phosphate cytidylyltransferase [Actinomycetota bacterium]